MRPQVVVIRELKIRALAIIQVRIPVPLCTRVHMLSRSHTCLCTYIHTILLCPCTCELHLRTSGLHVRARIGTFSIFSTSAKIHSYFKSEIARDPLNNCFFTFFHIRSSLPLVLTCFIFLRIATQFHSAGSCSKRKKNIFSLSFVFREPMYMQACEQPKVDSDKAHHSVLLLEQYSERKSCFFSLLVNDIR